MARLILCTLLSLGMAACGDPASPPRLDSLTVSPQNDTLRAVGATSQLVAQGLDSRGRPLPIIVHWTSNSDAVTVTQTGVVTAMAAGAADVSASAGDITASARIVVILPPPAAVISDM